MSLTAEHRVPMEVEFESSWLTWVAAATAVLRALDVDRDATDIAGQSGYAFMINVHEDLCPSGPTSFDWGLLAAGLPWLGRSPLVYAGGQHDEGDRPSPVLNEQWRYLYDFVEREVASGRPCLLWGAYVPEFAVVVGVGSDHYWVRSFKEALNEPQPAVEYRGLEAAGGLYALALPTITDPDPREADRRAIEHAVEMMTWHTGSPWYTSGLEAYDRWIASLATGKADPFGNAFNARCWAEARGYARDFVDRIARRVDPNTAAILTEARLALAESAAALSHLADLCPLHPRDTWMMDDARGAAVEELHDAKLSDRRALHALMEAIAAWHR